MNKVLRWRRGIRRVSLVLAILVGSAVLLGGVITSLQMYFGAPPQVWPAATPSSLDRKVLDNSPTVASGTISDFHWAAPSPVNEIIFARFSDWFIRFSQSLFGSLATTVFASASLFFVVWLVPFWIIHLFARFGHWIADGFRPD